VDGGYAIAGYTGTHLSCDVYLIRTGADGDTLWTRTYGGDRDDIGLSVQQVSDGGYTIAGWTDSYGAGNQDVYVIRTDHQGDTLWTRTYGGASYDYGQSVQQSHDGAFVVGGHTSSFGAGDCDIYLIKMDISGDSIWTRAYDGPGSEEGYSIELSNDGGYVIAGRVWSYGGYAGDSDVYLMKTEPDRTGGNMPFQLMTAPNPSSGWVSIRYLLPVPGIVRIVIYDVMGREVSVVKDHIETGGPRIAYWNGKDSHQRSVSPGIYFCCLQAGSRQETRKVVIVK
jgi:hypothetical protein